MRAQHGNKIVEIWKIDPENINEDCVNKAFENELIWWNMSDKKILVVNNSDSILTGILPKKKIAGLGVSTGKLGWYLVKSPDNNLTVVDEKHFEKEYTLS